MSISPSTLSLNTIRIYTWIHLSDKLRLQVVLELVFVPTHGLTHPAGWRITKILVLNRAMSQWETFQQFSSRPYRSKENLASVYCIQFAQNKLGTFEKARPNQCSADVVRFLRCGVPLCRMFQWLNHLFDGMLRQYQVWNVGHRFLSTWSIQLTCQLALRVCFADAA